MILQWSPLVPPRCYRLFARVEMSDDVRRGVVSEALARGWTGTWPYQILHSGHVKKQRVSSNSGQLSAWQLTGRQGKSRFLELHPTALLWVRLHQTTTDKELARGYICLDAGTEIMETPPLLGHDGTIVVRAGDRKLSFRCTSVEQHRDWFNEIKTVIKSNSEGNIVAQRLTGSFISGAGGKMISRCATTHRRDVVPSATLTSFRASLTGSRGSRVARNRVARSTSVARGKDPIPMRVCRGRDRAGRPGSCGWPAWRSAISRLGSRHAAGSDEDEDCINLTGADSEARLLAITGNAACADCRTSNPTHYPNTPAWGSVNLGCLFCIRCAGIHRKMGVHVSKVRRVHPDPDPGPGLGPDP